MIGMILEQKMSVKLGMEVNKTMVKLVMTYGAESWQLRRKAKLLESTEMRMLWWTAGICLKERRINEEIRRRGMD